MLSLLVSSSFFRSYDLDFTVSRWKRIREAAMILIAAQPHRVCFSKAVILKQEK